MRLLRTFLLVVFVLGLLALDVSLVLRRVESRKAEWSQEVLASVQTGLEAVADGLEQDLAIADALARWISGLPEVAALLAGAGEPTAAASALAPLLAATPRLRRVELLEGPGPHWIVARAGGGDPELQAAPAGAPRPAPGPAEDGHGTLELKGFFVAGSTRAGVLAVLDGPPLPEHIAGFGNWQGARTRLLPPGHTAAGEDGSVVTVVRPLRRASSWSLLGEVPADALQPPRGWRTGQLVQTFTLLAGLTLLLLLVGAAFLHLFARSTRLRETERYLRWIRGLTDRYRALMDGAADMVLIVDPQAGTVLESSAAARAALPLPDRPAPSPEPHPAAGDGEPPTPLATLFAAEPLRLVQDALAGALATGRPQALPEVRVAGRDGRQLLADARIAAVDVGGQPLLQVSLRDLTQQKEIERRLATAGRLSSLGLLTAGVAHEINNPLEGIGNYLSLLQQDDLPPERRRRYLEQVHHGLHRIRDIVADLLQFSRPQVGRGSVDLVAVVDRALSLAAYSKALGGVRLVRAGLERPLPVHGDAGRLEQVVLNLLLNAARATGSGAVLLSARVLPAGEGRGETIELAVEDEGPGIRPEHLDRVFDPFFTTEGGTGLGLSVSYGIVQAHGGTLTAANRPQGGACFTLRLPADGAGGTGADEGAGGQAERAGAPAARREGP